MACTGEDLAVRTKARRRWMLALFVVAMLAVTVIWLVGVGGRSMPGRAYDESAIPARFGSARLKGDLELAETDVFMTPDEPLKPGRNAIWCASFLVGWQELKKTTGGNVRLEGADDLCAKLNAWPEVAPLLPPEGFYAASGTYSEQWAQQVRRDVGQKVTSTAVPDFPVAAPGMPISYSCLYSRLSFPKPYFDWDPGLDFRGTRITAFGIEAKDEYAYYELRQQIDVLYAVENDYTRQLDEFAIDISRESAPNQLIVAKIAPGGSLEQVWKSLTEKMHRFSTEKDDYFKHIGPNDTVGVPEMNFDIWHEFDAISGRQQVSPGAGSGLPRRFLQNLRFRLDRSGAELWSQSPAPCAPIPVHYVLDGSFLVAMRRREAGQPYLMLWIETPELLRKR